MKKIREINLNPGYGLADYPHMSRGKVKSHNGGITMSADRAMSSAMQRVNKNFEEEEDPEEVDQYVDNVNLLKEFALDTILGYGKVAFMGIPGWGDLFALGSLVGTIVELRAATRKFTAELSKVAGLEPPGIGDDFLEPEGVSKEVLDSNLVLISHRLRNLREYNESQMKANKPPLKVTEKDMKRLQKMYYTEVCDRIKKAMTEFIGFADAFFGQKGTIINLGIQGISAAKIPHFVTSQWAEYVTDVNNEAKAVHSEMGQGKEYGGLLSFFRDTFGTIASGLLYPPKKVLDLLGNLDLLINPAKLKRLKLVNDIFVNYSDVDTNEEYQDEGLFSTPGSSYQAFLQDQGLDAPGVFANINPINPESIVKDEPEQLEEFISRYGYTLRENYSLLEVYENINLEEDTEEEEVDEHAVAGGIAPMGRKLDGSLETDKERKKRHRDADIYREQLRRVQNWKHMTSGRIK